MIENLQSSTRKLRGTAHGETAGAKAPVSESCLVCNVGKADVQYFQGYAAPQSDYWVCETDAADEPDGKANQIYMLEDLPKGFLANHAGLLETGRSRICIPNAVANRSSYKVEIPKGAAPPKYLGERHDPKPENAGLPGHRQLMTATGTHTVLVVMVSSSKTGETDPNTNATIVAGNFFGTGPMAQNVSVASQYQACSNGKLQMVPYTSKYVSNGILAVQVPIAIAGTPTLTTIQNAVLAATLTALNATDIRSTANHVLFCLPQGKILHVSRSSAMAFVQI